MRILPTLLFGFSHQLCPDSCDCSVKKLEANDATVDCSGRQLVAFPSAAYLPENAAHLNFADNEIEEFSTNNLDVDFITSLNLSQNKLTVFLDPQRKKWTLLESLDLSNNDLRWIPLTMFQRMKSLQSLNLSGNELINIDQVKFPPFLMNLDVSHNQLTTLMARRFLPKASSLTQIDLSHNAIQIIEPGALSHLQNLEKINLSNNKLVEVGHKSMYGLVRCHDIDLGNNMISDISPTAFINFGHKSFENKTVNLVDNQMSFVMADWVQELENEAKFCEVQNQCGVEVKVLLKGNPIYCDCNMQQVRDQHELVFGDLDHAMCANDDVSIEDFHDEICCDIANTE